MLRAGIVGVGFMGWIHYLAYQRSSHAMLSAFCSRDERKRAGDWTQIKGNFGPPGSQIDVGELATYESLEEMLDNREIDLIDICLPPHLHVDAACKALAAGKHVLCEKPLGLNSADCDKILTAAKQANKRVLVAQVLPYMGEFQFAYQAVMNGDYGVPKHGFFKRVISPPDWIPDFYSPSKVGGPLIDLHVHDAHFVRLVFGMPRRVMCSAEMSSSIVKYCHTLMEFASPGVIVGTSSGVSDQNARPFCHGFELQLDRALIQFELSAHSDGVDIMPLRVFGQDGKSMVPALPGGDEVSAFAAEIDDAVNTIRSGIVEPRLDCAIARDAIHICECLQKSAELGSWVNCT
ncbi:MAG: Gfo/Idh/MocA family oxidoreductase [Planctomycetales bacterium]|nr:Gfo/Idh/MocA family oxidoreductase [Planctomycetales bacterium]